MWYDGPGHSRCIDLSDHPEHTQPAEVFSSFLPGQHLCKKGENNGHSTSYPAKKIERVEKSVVDRAQERTETELHLFLSYTIVLDIGNDISISLNVYLIKTLLRLKKRKSIF